jgi:parallel beta-helix repeat protein
MRKRLMFFVALVAASLTVSLAASSAMAEVVYNAVPSSLPANVASVGFEATSTSEFGDYVHLAGTDRNLKTVTVTMSDWALASDYPSLPASGWSHLITVNVYSNHLGGNGAPDTLLATKTQSITIPWRPAADPTCATPTAWRSLADGQCYNGFAFNATFDLSTPNVTLPDDVIVGIAYNTADYGSAPIHTAGPYNSLNVGIPTGQTASVGTDDSADHVFWNTSFAPFYADLGVLGVGIFRQDTNWTPNGTVALKVTTAATCQPTGFSAPDGTPMTAARIGGTVSGTVDATGCNIGAYFNAAHPGTVTGADIYGANYYGVLSNGTASGVANSSIHNIGETPLNGSQHGNAIVYMNGAKGTISGNTVSHYQKNGITVRDNGSSATVKNNTVTGEGQINYIAQNGIQISFGASASVTGNSVSGNWYTPAGTTACGLLFFQAGGVKQSANNVFANEMNLCNAGRGGGGFTP